MKNQVIFQTSEICQHMDCDLPLPQKKSTPKHSSMAVRMCNYLLSHFGTMK